MVSQIVIMPKNKGIGGTIWNHDKNSLKLLLIYVFLGATSITLLIRPLFQVCMACVAAFGPVDSRRFLPYTWSCLRISQPKALAVMTGQKSEAELRAAAEEGDANAQNMLGDMYREAVGVRQDYSQAMSWYRKGAESGNAYSEYWLGEMYGDGLGVEKNYEQAMTWLHKSMTHGDPDALNTIVYYRAQIAKEFPFSVGHVSCSPAAAATLRENLPVILQCHKRGSWGDIDLELEIHNLRSLKHGGPLLSIFLLKSGKFAEVQTDGLRRSTYVNIKGEQGGMFNNG